MSTKFFTNDSDNTLLNKFKGIFENNNIHDFDALVGYFRSSGYFRVRDFLKDVPKVRILLGIDVDKLVKDSHQRGLEFFRQEMLTREEFVENMLEDIRTAKYDRETEKGIEQFINDILEKKLEIRAHPDKKIHAKVYIFRPEQFNEHRLGGVITGSSNFTDQGLGYGDKHNYEFNVFLNDYDEVQFATDEFEKLWKDGVEILPSDVSRLRKETHLNDQITPFELYVKLLIEYFGQSIEYDPDSLGDLPPNFKKLSYQVDAVNEALNMLMKHNGCILADVVGLGKTVIAAMLAKKFLIKNGREYTKILVVYPPAIEKNWKNTFKDFKLDRYTKFITNGSLAKILDGHEDYWDHQDYDLIIVDEAHKFRNHQTEGFQHLQRICKSPRKNTGFVEGLQKKVVLVTATPLNNRPDDIYHQISMFQDLRRSTLPVRNLTSFFAPLIDEYKRLKRYEKLDIEKLRVLYSKIRKSVIEPITVRRTRTDIEKIPEYLKDLKEQGIVFPKVDPPKKLEYALDTELSELFYKTIFNLVDEDKIQYYRYQAIFGLKNEVQIKYYENAETIAKSLAFIMKTQLVKRLESSFFAFKKSLTAFKVATDRMIKMFERDKIFIAPDLEVNTLLDKGYTYDEIELEIQKLTETNPKNNIFKRSDFKPEFLPGLRKDARLLNELVEKWEGITRDPKFEEFFSHLDSEFFNPVINHGKKLVIFSESKDTVDFLTKEFETSGRKDVLSISSHNRRSSYDDIVNNFDANIEKAKQKDDFNIIITTEVLAEGVNLHRSNIVIHYDTPWNSTRLIQRIGRVNRIGTSAPVIYNFVFYPSPQGESQIGLKRTAFMKLQAFHTALGEDNQVLTVDEILDDVKLFSGQFKEEEDERLEYLFFLRKLKKEQPGLFNNVKKLPLKARCGRDSSLTGKPERAGSSVAFIKTKVKHEFYFINDTDGPVEIPPIEAIKLFQAKSDEVAYSLIENHHTHIAASLEYFHGENIKANLTQVDATALGGVAQRAKKFISDLNNLPQVNQKLKINLSKVIKLIDQGKYTNLAADIDRLHKSVKKNKLNINATMNELEKIIRDYDIEIHETDISDNKEIFDPQLILSESFL